MSDFSSPKIIQKEFCTNYLLLLQVPTQKYKISSCTQFLGNDNNSIGDKRFTYSTKPNHNVNKSNFFLLTIAKNLCENEVQR